MLSRVRLFATPWTVTRQALLSMGFSRPLDYVSLEKGDLHCDANSTKTGVNEQVRATLDAAEAQQRALLRHQSPLLL